jgi:serine protease
MAQLTIPMKNRIRPLIRPFMLALAAAAALVSGLADGNADRPRELKLQGLSARQAAGAAPEELVSGLIVRPHRRRGAKLAHALRQRDAGALSKIAGVRLRVHRQMSDDAHVLRLDQPLTLEQARSISAQLMRGGDIELAEPDRVLRPSTTLPPNDPGYSFQWHYFAPTGSNLGGANLPNAWQKTVGLASVKVAVLDTGYRPHSDLVAVLAGYDFVTSDSFGNDAQSGRDTDATDPGDNCSATGNRSSWHGTHVAGTIGALISNAGPPGQHGAGIAPEIGLVPVRVLGKCGGVTSDIIDAMRWAAGIAVPSASVNANPAKVLNLSLGGGGACSAAMQSAVDDVVNQGAAVVVAAGNDASLAVSSPANCSGVIAVTAHAIDGDNANYSNIAKQVAISAPGGGCGTLTTAATCTSRLSANGLGVYSLSNTGTTTPVASPGGDSYASGTGTSMAAPHVTGVIALMQSHNASLGRPALTPAQIKSYLQSSARAHPAGSTCTLARYVGLCGEGLLDAEGALIKTEDQAPSIALADSFQVVAPGQNVQLSGTRTLYAGRTSANFVWTQVASVSVGLSVTSVKVDTATASFSAPASGVYTFQLMAQDSASKVGIATATVKVNSPPALTAPATQTVTVGQQLSFKVSATDPDGDSVQVSAGPLPNGASFSGGTFTWLSATPVGTYNVTYTATDVDGASATSTVVINVVNPSGGGGGSLDLGTLAALGLLALALRLRRAYRGRPA